MSTLTVAQGLASRALAEISSLAKRELDTDRQLVRVMSATIEAARTRYPLDAGAQWKPGAPLKLLMAGYSGTRNTGADVRVEEMIKQFRHLFGDDHLELSLLTLDPALSKGYFRTVEQLHLPQFFPPFLFDAVHAHHGVIACEGSMFKSKFASALSTMMVGSLGLAVAENKLAVGYGGEAGAMDEALDELVRRSCRDAFVITRNEESREVLRRLGVPSRAGTDTAWTFEAASPSVGEAMLRRAGWDGRARVLVLCPINPFWWPVKPDVMKGAVHALTRAHKGSHYSSFYFHRDGEEVAEKQRRYIEAFAAGVRRFCAEERTNGRIFPICVGMEQLDRRACEALSASLGGLPVFVSDEHEMYEMVSLLRVGSLMASSRYHAIVTSMPAGVASVGVTMDERIRNLMRDRGQPELALEVDDPALEDKLYRALIRCAREAEAVRDGIERSVVRNVVRMGEMGRHLVDHVRGRHPDLPLRPELGGAGDPLAHLPPLSRGLTALFERHGASA